MATCDECGDPIAEGGCCGKCAVLVAMRDVCRPDPGLPVVEGYEPFVVLGTGGFSTVYLAERKTDRLQVALKVYRSPDHPGQSGQYAAEADALARVRHGALVENGLAHNPPFLAMKFVDGDSFRNWPGRADRRAAVRVVRQAARDLQGDFHNVGLCHLDVKPDNLLVDGETPGWIDFGCARPAGQTFAAEVPGTPGYMAPEVRTGLATPPADVYALGGLLMFAVTGRDPTDTAAPPTVPHDLRPIVDRCRQPDPDDRYQSAAHVADALGRWMDGLPPDDAGTWVWARYWLARNRVAVAVVAACVALTAGLAISQLVQRERRAAAEKTRFLTELADADFARGHWAAAASGYAAVVARGSPDRPRLEVARLKCDLRRNARTDADVEATVAAMLANPDLASVKADLLLLRGERLLADYDRRDDARSVLREALAADPPLSDADRRYATGLLAQSPEDGLDAFRSALDADPTHYPAQAAQAAVVLLLNRREEAAALTAVLRRRHPDDPFPDLLDMIARLLDGDEATGRLRWADVVHKLGPVPDGPTVADFPDIAAGFRLLRAINRQPGGMGMGGVSADQVKEIGNLTARFDRIRGRTAKTAPLGIPSPVVVWYFETADAYRQAAVPIMSGYANTLKRDSAASAADRANVAAVLDPALARFASAELLYLSASVHFLAAQDHFFAGRPADWQRELDLVRQAAERGATAPAVFPGAGYDYLCLTFAVVVESLLLTPALNPAGVDPARERRLAKRIADLCAAAAPSDAVRAESMFVVMSPLDGPTRRRVTAAWATLTPADPTAWHRLADLEWESGSWGTAFDAAGRWAKAAAGDELVTEAVRAWQVAKSRAWTIRHFPAVSAVGGPAAAVAIPGVATQVRPRNDQ